MTLSDETATDPLAELRLDALRRQLGEVAWLDRMVRAEERAAVVRKARALLEHGMSWSAVAASCDITAGTLHTWVKRYESAGLAGLIDRSGKVKEREEVQIAERRGQRLLTKPAVSFVKWAGSKRGVMRRLVRFMPAEYGTYYEPFLGSGTVFFTLRARCAVLNDINVELMNCYEVVRDHVEELIAALDPHHNSYEHFIAVRGQDPTALAAVERAARLIYLNKTCYNGLYRVNRHGHFNVPYGRNPDANFRDKETLRRTSGLLQSVLLRCGDYREALRRAGSGDLVYLDPPYVPRMTKHGQWSRYQPKLFDGDAHTELAEVFRDLDRRGCHVVLSNSDLPAVHRLYSGYTIEVLATRRQIHHATDKRAGHREVVVSNRPPAAAPRGQLPLIPP